MGSRTITIKTQDEVSDEQMKKLVIGGGDGNPPTLSSEDFKILKEETNRLRTIMAEGITK
ncbi:MAG TPA: hypothetical protein ENI20_08705 [Bacteroides sp.]|nr:hypothetical protein [Bacteroides sp.]